MEKRLGKITFAEFGTVRDYPFLLGMRLEFSFPGGCIGDGYKYTVNISDKRNWENDSREDAITSAVEKVYETLKAAKVGHVSELVGEPVEVTVDQNCFKDFRILTEVL